MAPRIPESFAAFEARLRQAITDSQVVIRFGQQHHSHAVCLEDGLYRVRKLEHSAEEAEQFMKEHGMFMPENAEAINEPRTLLFEAADLKELLARLETFF